MISRPTTDVLLRDCARELLEQVLPSVQGEPAQVRVHMLATVLQNAAVRAAHEIAWMREESEAAVAYAQVVGLDAALPEPSLHLADAVSAYDAAGDLLGRALVAAQSDPALLARGEQLLEDRLAHEREVQATYVIVGR